MNSGAREKEFVFLGLGEMALAFILALVSVCIDFGITTLWSVGICLFHARDETFGDGQVLSPKLTTFSLP